MKSFAIIIDGFNDQFVSAKSAGEAKYNLWLKSACDAGYWESFFDFCKSCRVISLGRDGAVNG